MTRIIFTYAQLKAAKDLLANGSPIDWVAYEEFKELIRTAPLDVPEEVDDGWDALKQALDADRPSARKLFPPEEQAG